MIKRILAALAIASLSFVGSASADNWTGGGSGSFSSAVNRITTGVSNSMATPTTPFTLEVWASATAGGKTDTLPNCASGINGYRVLEVDGEGNGATNTISVSVASGTIGAAGTPAPTTSALAVATNGGAAEYQCDSAATHWALVSASPTGNGVRSNTTASLTIGASDNGGVIYQNSASAVTATIAQAGTAGFPEDGYAVHLINAGAGAVAINPTTSTINGAASFTVPGGTPSAPVSVMLYADGTGNYVAALMGNGGSGTVNSGTVDAPAYYSSGTGISSTAALTNGQILIGSTGNPPAPATPTGSGGVTVTGGAGSLAIAGTPPVSYLPGYFYWADVPNYTNSNSTTGATTTTNCHFFVMPVAAHINVLGVKINTSGTTTVDVAIYANGSANTPTGSPLVSTGNIADTSSGTIVTASVTSTALAAGLYWQCLQANDTTVTVQGVGGSTALGPGMAVGATTAAGLVSGPNAVVVEQVTGGTYGTWPTTGWTATNGASAELILGIQSVP